MRGEGTAWLAVRVWEDDGGRIMPSDVTQRSRQASDRNRHGGEREHGECRRRRLSHRRGYLPRTVRWCRDALEDVRYGPGLPAP